MTTRTLAAVVFALVFVTPAATQTAPPLDVASIVGTCVVTASQRWAPTPDTGWGVRFTIRRAGGALENLGTRDTTAPYARGRTVAAGTYTLAGTWTRSGSAPVAIAPVMYTCGDVAPPPPPSPAPVHCAGTWSPWSPVAPGEWSACVAGSQSRQESQTFTVTTAPANGGTACPASPVTRTVTRACVVAPPPSAGGIWGPVHPDTLGEWTATEHDAFVLDGGDGWKYRTWHPQCLDFPSGLTTSGFVRRCAAHEHGDNPASQGDAWVRSKFDARFGYAARRHKDMPGEPDGHVEAHEGFKVFVANKGDTNDEGRVNRTWTTASFHMGTGGPARFGVRHHSGSLASRHDWPGEPQMRIAFHVLADTGGVATVCDPRVQAPVKDVMQLDSPCKLPSQYEIWRAETALVDASGVELARVFQTPATFDPITIRNPANPSEVVYAHDPRMAASKQFPGDDWSGNKDVERETYAQNPYLYTQGRSTSDYWLNPLGRQVAATAPDAIPAFIEAGINRLGVISTQDNLQFKMRVDYGRACEPDRDGACTRQRAGIAGTTNASKIGLRN